MGEQTHPDLGWRDVAEAVPGGVAVQTGETFAHVTADLAAVVGVDADALVGESWRTLFDAREATRLANAVERAREEGQWEGTARAGGPHGSETTLDLTLSATGSGAVVWTASEVAGDHADRAGPDGRTTARPGVVRSVLDAVEDVVYVIDEDGRFALWNDALAEVTGYSHAEIAEMEPAELIPEDHHDYVPGLNESIDAIEDRRVDVDVLTADGERVTHEFTGTTFENPATGERFRCGVARDVTDRRARERDLERYETIVETVEDGIYALDDEGRFSFVNEGFCELFDLSREEAVGMPGRELHAHGDEFETDVALRERLLAAEDDTGRIEATLPSPDGERVVESRYRLHPEPDGEFRGSVGVVRDVTEVRRLQRELREERQFVENVVDALDDVLYVVDEDGGFAFWNDELCDRFGYDDEEMAELDPRTFLTSAESGELPPDSADIVDIPDRHNVVDLRTVDGHSIPHELRGATYTDAVTGERYRVGIGRDVTERIERERALERQRDELAALDRINELLLETVRELVQTASREAVERTVCERLVSSALYEFAWVGGPGLDGDGIRRRTAAGTDRGFHDAVDGGDVEPVRRAVDTGEVQVGVVDDGERPEGGRADSAGGRAGSEDEPWRAAARERGLTSVVAVPIRYDETVYGVLVVYADREDAVGEREQAGFDVLGRTVGVVVHAARSRELLFADSVVELEFAVADTDDVLVEAAAAHDCTLSLDGYVAVDDRWITYLTVDGAPPATVVDRVVGAPEVERARVVGDAGDSSRVEVVVTGSSLVTAAAAADATVRSLTATSDEARLVLETPPEADLRGVVEHLRTAYPGAHHVATRDRDREVTATGRPDGIVDGLTERQQEALRTAYRAGYYAWPRESTAEEVAAALDLSPPTLHGHLRKAEGAILSALLDGD